ncbi:MAG: phosphoenolpyruvate carboxykinase (GTP), partial [Chloroflexi bacterium]|nr:phosphoenolpyruvate carboxykinase (GTP) [Chloroflexota bacterium]
MDKKTDETLKTRLGKEGYERLLKINNPDLHAFVVRYVEFCDPARVFVCTDSPADIKYIRESAVRNGEEMPLAVKGHTAHFDAYGDQGRDKEHTAILVPRGVDLGQSIGTKDRDEGLKDVHEILKGIMKGRELFICFFTLGPANSEFSIPCVQLTDSPYVAHSEDLLYRFGYQEFLRQGAKARFFKFVHSQGEVDERKVSKNLHNRRIYIDLPDNTVYSTNTQY